MKREITAVFVSSLCFGCTQPGSSSTLATAIESGGVDVDGLDEITDTEIGALERAYDALVAGGLIANHAVTSDSGEVTARRSTGCRSADDRGRLLGLELAAIYGKQGIESKYLAWYDRVAAAGFVVPNGEIDAHNWAHLWKMTYCTVDFDGSPAIASGMMAVPGLGWGQEVDTVMYGHGTTTYRLDAATNLDPDVSYEGIPTPLALVAGYDRTNTRGDIVLVPDGTGFGDSSIARHRYFDQVTQSASMVDMYDAAKWALPTFSVNRSGKVFITGFSQGGNVALGTARALQQRGDMVGGVITFAGALALESITVDYVATIPDPGAMLLVSYLASAAYDTEKLPGLSVDDIFLSTSTYDAFDMSLEFVEAVAEMPVDLESTFTSSFIDDQINTPGSDFRAWLGFADQTMGWCPTFPVVVTNAEEDFVVPIDFASAWQADWSSRCPSSDISLDVTTTANNPYGQYHDQTVFNELVQLGARFNAL